MKNLVFFIIFIVIVILVYSLLNYYFLKKHNNILTSRSLPRLISRLLIFTVILTPFGTILFSGMKIPLLAAITGFTGYSWLAFLFLFLTVHGLIDIIIFVFEKVGFTAPECLPKIIFTATTLLSISVLTFGFFEAGNIKIERISFETSKLPDSVNSIRIMQISDIHFSSLIGETMAEKIFAIAESEKPDLIVSTGDMLDRGIRNSAGIHKIMSSMNAPMGKYAITGNHEFIADIQYSLDFINKSGFAMIRNDYTTINNAINLVGVDDPTINRYDNKFDVNRAETNSLASINNKLYTVLLKHQPRIVKDNIKYLI